MLLQSGCRRSLPSDDLRERHANEASKLASVVTTIGDNVPGSAVDIETISVVARNPLTFDTVHRLAAFGAEGSLGNRVLAAAHLHIVVKLPCYLTPSDDAGDDRRTHALASFAFFASFRASIRRS